MSAASVESRHQVMELIEDSVNKLSDFSGRETASTKRSAVVFALEGIETFYTKFQESSDRDVGVMSSRLMAHIMFKEPAYRYETAKILVIIEIFKTMVQYSSETAAIASIRNMITLKRDNLLAEIDDKSSLSTRLNRFKSNGEFLFEQITRDMPAIGPDNVYNQLINYQRRNCICIERSMAAEKAGNNLYTALQEVNSDHHQYDTQLGSLQKVIYLFRGVRETLTEADQKYQTAFAEYETYKADSSSENLFQVGFTGVDAGQIFTRVGIIFVNDKRGEELLATCCAQLEEIVKSV